jgi:nucleoside-diphosphate-sugar epimerase
MDVLVTGGCGYIGSVLVPLLQGSPAVNQITVLDNLNSGSPANLRAADLGNNNLGFREGDVRGYDGVESAVGGADTVVHLAAITGAASTHDKAEKTRAVNLEGTRNVLKTARKFDVDRVVFASSCNNYGRVDEQELDETVEPNPINPYAKTKLAAEILLEEFTDNYGIETTALRMSTVYGDAPGIRFNLVVNGFVFRALTDRPITVYGDGSNWRPFVHVQDAARAFLDATRRPEHWPELVYNVGAGDENYRIEEIATIVDETLNRKTRITYLEDKQPGPSYHVNFDRLQETGFELNWTLSEGIRDLAEQLGSSRPSPQRESAYVDGELHD